MSRPTRNEALPEIWVSTSGGDYAVRGRKFGSYDTVMPAPKGAVLLAPDTCPTCEGQGVHPITDNPTPGDGPICPSCGGRGYVWPDELVERIARSWYQTEADTDEWDFCLRISRRMLDAWVEVDDHET